MDEYINKTKFEELMRKKARNYFDLYYADKIKEYHIKAIGCSLAADEAYDFPAEDVQPVKHGQWIDHEKFERNNCNVCIECSVCNTWFGHDCIPKTNYCPNCGARMDGEQDD